MSKNILRIRARSGQFRRAGILFGKAVTEVAEADLSKDQIAALSAEPALIVEHGTVVQDSGSKTPPAHPPVKGAADQDTPKEDAPKKMTAAEKKAEAKKTAEAEK